MFGRLLFYLFLMKFTIGNPNVSPTTTEKTTENGTTSQITVESGKSTSTTEIPQISTTPTVPVPDSDEAPQPTKPVEPREETEKETVYNTPKSKPPDSSIPGQVIGFIVVGIFLLVLVGAFVFCFIRAVCCKSSEGNPFEIRVNAGF